MKRQIAADLEITFNSLNRQRYLKNQDITAARQESVPFIVSSYPMNSTSTPQFRFQSHKFPDKSDKPSMRRIESVKLSADVLCDIFE